MADALSIEQNNKIRVALGLKPLPVPGAEATSGPVFKEAKDTAEEEEPGSTLESREALGFQNWQKIQDDAEAKRRRQEKNAAIKRARDLAQRDAKIEGQSLGELGTGGLDTKAWLSQHKKLSKKIEKERARKLAEELAERDRAAEYTAADLAGIKVAHEMGDFDEAVEGQVLTLKDATIDENEEEGDELENLDMVDREKLKEKLELKKKRTAYDPMNADGPGSILAQYDEEIDGKKRKHFTLDAKGSTTEEREAKRQHVSDMLNKQSFNLDIVTEAPQSDYMDISEVKIKKPKKKKAKTIRQKAVDEDDIFPIAAATGTTNGDTMEIDEGQSHTIGGNAISKKKSYDTSFVDDEDLQASLAIQRRAAFKKRKNLRPEELARQLREEDSQTPMDVESGEGVEDEPGLIIDETSEFVSNLQRPVISERRERRTSTPAEVKEETVGQSPDEDMEDEDMNKAEADVKPEEEVLGEGAADAENPRISGTGLDEESTLDEGLGSTLAMLRQRGLVEQSEAADMNSLHRDRQKFLQEKYRREADAEKRARSQRERDRTTGKLDRMSAREREEYARWENKQRDQQESRQMADIFNREYKPDVQLKYVDEHGRLMNQKEAFKHLSHQFHGKGSGKMKTEKHLKKIEEEKKREAMSALESSQHTGMNSAMGATAKKNRQAGVRLA